MSDAGHSHGKSKKKVRKPDHEPDPEFQIAPMIDILLVLLVFFMSISSTEVLQSNKEIHLPIAKEAKEAKDNPGQVIINVTYTPMNDMTGVELDQKDYSSPSDLVPLLQNKVAANPLVRVLIRADREVKYDFVRQVLQAVGQSGIGNVTFSVVDKEASPSTPS
ncbi:MAG: biopolymer transporter ExbD [Verrucomicrobia bacterium]|jgi:biopolymer transport protein ExbD|nr:biopolymer transporter ExbD [Verrucomicrobiota bacterium]